MYAVDTDVAELEVEHANVEENGEGQQTAANVPQAISAKIVRWLLGHLQMSSR